MSILEWSFFSFLSYCIGVTVFLLLHKLYHVPRIKASTIDPEVYFSNKYKIIDVFVLSLVIGATILVLQRFGFESIFGKCWIVASTVFTSHFLVNEYRNEIAAFTRGLLDGLYNLYKLYQVHEIDASKPEGLPKSPSLKEKYLYIKRDNQIMLFFSIISFSAIQFSMFHFLMNNTLMWPLFFYFLLTCIYFLDSTLVNISTKDFDMNGHTLLKKKWGGALTDSVDVFLPTAGEPLEVLRNTWEGVDELRKNYRGLVTVYCLDDGDRPEVKVLAEKYGFVYSVRLNRGWYKKAGNLRHGYKISQGMFVAIFDADFRPRADFLEEMLPYFYEYNNVGLVQSPQYFDVQSNQNWLQRGAGAVQELFYRNSQVSRQNHNASICVGSNAIYRRSALDQIGGTALIEHSEDVHTGFNMRMKGWTIQYIPIILAKGLCPADMKAFFKQQYRWCLGSLSLLSSKKFWSMRVTLKARLSYFSGFLYYIHTAVSSFFVPVVPLAILIFYPEQVSVQNYLLILPSILFVQVIYPLWHNATYGIEAWATRSVYGWAHIFAVIDAITKKKMQWQPTGAIMRKDFRYSFFRVLQVIFNLLPSVVWIYLAAEFVVIKKSLIFLPLFFAGLYYYLMSAKVAFYKSAPLSITDFKYPVRQLFQNSTAAFLIFSVFAFSAVGLLLQMKHAANITVSHKATTISPAQVIKPFAVHPEYYEDIAAEGDTFGDVIDRILNTYSAETGEILSLKQRAYIKSALETTTSKQISRGQQVNLSTKDLKTLLSQNK